MTAIERQLRALFADAGVQGWAHCRGLHGGPEIGLEPDVHVVMASVYKLPLLVAFCRAVDDGLIDPRQPVLLEAEGRTRGATGISILRDPVTMSWRDIAATMIAVSDNAAADALLRELGLPFVTKAIRDLGLTATVVMGGTADTYAAITRESGSANLASALASLRNNDKPSQASAYSPHLASSTTARDMTDLLALIWNDTAASPDQCAFARTLLANQVWPHRLRSGFPYGGVTVSGKTGSLGALRHEVGVIEFEHDGAYAIAVFTQAARADRVLPRADAVIGAAAAACVAALRST